MTVRCPQIRGLGSRYRQGTRERTVRDFDSGDTRSMTLLPDRSCYGGYSTWTVVLLRVVGTLGGILCLLLFFSSPSGVVGRWLMRLSGTTMTSMGLGTGNS